MSQKKKLLVTASTFPRWEGDTEPRFILDYAKEMTEYYDVTVLAPYAVGSMEHEVLEGVVVKRFHYFPISRFETLCAPGAIIPRVKEKKLRGCLIPFFFISLYIHLLFLSNKYDVIHAHWIIPQGIIHSFIRKDYIITGHGGDISSFNRGILKRIKERCLRKAQKVVVVSKYKQRELRREFPDIDCEIIPMGVNTDLFNRNKNRVENLFKQGENKVLLYVGRLAEIKGVDYLIEAMKYLENVKLIIVGDGPEMYVLQQKADLYRGKVEFWGSKTHEELKQIYASADILIVPSIIDKKGAQEGLPTVIMEAFASRLPVIATKTGGIPDLIEDEITGLLIKEKDVEDLCNKINKLIEDEILYRNIQDNGYRVSQERDYKNVAQKYYQLLNKMEK